MIHWIVKKAREFQENIYFCFFDYTKAFDCVQFSSVAQSCPTLRPRGQQHIRPPCPSPSPRVCPSSSPLNQWCHPTISSSVAHFISWPQSFPAWVFSIELSLHIRWPKYWSCSFNISPSYEYPGLISFSIDWFDLLAFQGTFTSLLQHHSLKASIVLCSAFFMV